MNNKIHKLLEQVQDHNLDTIKELNTENEKNKDYLSTLIGKVSEIIEKNKKEPKTLSKTVSKTVFGAFGELKSIQKPGRYIPKL